MKIEDIKAQCEALSNEELLMVVNNKIRYTEKIVRVAQQELRKRALSKEEVDEFKKKQSRRARIIDGNIHEDLMLWEKIFFFFLFFFRPLFFMMRDYRRKKYVLKTRQAGYFMTSGGLFFLLLLWGGRHRVSLSTGAVIWVVTFMAAYAFNQYYFKERTVRRLAARFPQAMMGKERE